MRCRWGTEDEAKFADHHSGFYDSISLDEENCILTYDGTQDLNGMAGKIGYKPIGIQIEDFDEDGNVKSSTPIQFPARTFLLDENEFDVRKRRADPSYCEKKPIITTTLQPDPSFSFPVPATGITLDLEVQGIETPIVKFQYNRPLGMHCSEFFDSSNGATAICNFTPTQEQIGTVVIFCYNAVDGNGLTTERECATLDTRADAETTTTKASSTTTPTTLAPTTTTTQISTTTTVDLTDQVRCTISTHYFFRDFHFPIFCD